MEKYIDTALNNTDLMDKRGKRIIVLDKHIQSLERQHLEELTKILECSDRFADKCEVLERHNKDLQKIILTMNKTRNEFIKSSDTTGKG